MTDLESLIPDQRAAFIKLNEHFSALMVKLFEAEGTWPFHRPVNKAEYPHYYRMISRPLDFGTIRYRIRRNYYGRASTLLNDLHQVRDNCLRFNGPDHPFSLLITQLTSMAEKVLSSDQIKELEQKIHGTFNGIGELDEYKGDDGEIEEEEADGENVHVSVD